MKILQVRSKALSTTAGASATAVLGVAIAAVLSASSASALPAGPSLGSLYFSPNNGTSVTNFNLETTAGCPTQASNISAVVNDSSGTWTDVLILSNTTNGVSTGPMSVGVSNNLYNIATSKSLPLKSGTYTLTLRCTNRLQSQNYGTFSGTMALVNPNASGTPSGTETYTSEAKPGPVPSPTTTTTTPPTTTTTAPPTTTTTAPPTTTTTAPPTTTTTAPPTTTTKAPPTSTTTAPPTGTSSTTSSASTSAATLVVSDANGQVLKDGAVLTPGQQLNVAGDGYTPGSTVTAVVASTPTTVAQAQVDATGHVSFSAVLPSTLQPGGHTLTVSGAGSSAVFPFSVAATSGGSSDPGASTPVSSGSGSHLAFTGTNAAALSLTGLGLVGAGACALALARRSRRPARRH